MNNKIFEYFSSFHETKNEAINVTISYVGNSSPNQLLSIAYVIIRIKEAKWSFKKIPKNRIRYSIIF